MTPKKYDSKSMNAYTQQRIRQLLEEINQKLDYLIKLIREENLQYPVNGGRKLSVVAV